MKLDIKCNVPDLASLGNVVNVYVGSIVYNIQIINVTKDCKVCIMISLWITKWSNVAE